jgi:hypothetical protein
MQQLEVDPLKVINWRFDTLEAIDLSFNFYIFLFSIDRNSWVPISTAPYTWFLLGLVWKKNQCEGYPNFE